MRPLFLIFATLNFVFTGLAMAGDGVKGEGKVSQLLNLAHDVDLPKIVKTVNPENPIFDSVLVRVETGTGYQHVLFRDKYREMRKTFLTDLHSFELQITGDSLKDSTVGYHTWIGIDVDAKQILYNPTKFLELEMTLPTRQMMDEALLHEMGHYYKIDEDGCVTMARLLLLAYAEKLSSQQKTSEGNTNQKLTDPFEFWPEWNNTQSDAKSKPGAKANVIDPWGGWVSKGDPWGGRSIQANDICIGDFDEDFTGLVGSSTASKVECADETVAFSKNYFHRYIIQTSSRRDEDIKEYSNEADKRMVSLGYQRAGVYSYYGAFGDLSRSLYIKSDAVLPSPICLVHRSSTIATAKRPMEKFYEIDCQDGAISKFEPKDGKDNDDALLSFLTERGLHLLTKMPQFLRWPPAGDELLIFTGNK